MREPVIEVVGLRRTYRVGEVEVPALRGITLRVEAGEFVAVMGASGSGKSTLMHILGCLDRASEGVYRLEGVDTAEMTAAQRTALRSNRIGFVFQSFNLLPRTSAAANVELPLLYSGQHQLGRAARGRLARAALEAVGLGSRADHYPSQLSGGQQQRVALARALINKPALLLADEPTGNLDSATSREIMEMIRGLNREFGVTVVLVTHEPDVAAYAGRVVTLADGLVASDVQHADPERSRGVQRPQPRSPADAADAGGFSWSLMAMTVAAACGALARNKLRAGLTMLGIFIGVAALIAMLVLGAGAESAVKRQIASLGTSLFVILPGASTANGVRAGSSSASTLSVVDAETIAREDANVAQVSYLDRQVAQVQYANQNWSTAVEGVTPAFLDIENWHVAAGRALTREDDDSAAMDCLIGQTVYQKLFSPDEDPVGATLLVKGQPVRVVGLLAARGQSSFGTDQDDVVMMPFSTAERRVIGVAVPLQAPSPVTTRFPPAPNPYGLQPKLTGMVNLVLVAASGPDRVADAMAEATATLQRRHLIRPGDPDDFSVRNLSEIAATAEGTSRVIASLLAILASIALLVGGIGIMNILLVSVTERTREIGVRMALGAGRAHVLLQFLVEAALISLIAGAGGVVVGVGASFGIAALAKWPAELSLPAVAGSLLFSALVGIFFGYYPAHRAARLDPIEALRFE